LEGHRVTYGTSKGSSNIFGNAHIPYTDSERELMFLPADQPKTICRGCQYCERCRSNSELCRCGLNHVCGQARIAPPTYYGGNKPKEDKQDTLSNSGLSAKIKDAGFRVNANGQVLFAGKWIAPDEWQAKMPHVRI
jgi:hypothetical protein